MIDMEQNSSIFLQFLEVNFIKHNLSSHQPHLFIVIILGKTLDLSQGNYLCREMKATLIAQFVALLLVGCVGDRRIDYYENGQKKWDRSYKDRQLIGPVTWWYESGQIKKEFHHKYGGKMHGPATWWYENGQKMFNRNYNDGRILGLSKEWHENGQKKEEVFYEMTGETKEVVIPSIPFDRFGNKIEPSTKLVKVVKLIYKTIWYESGKKKFEVQWKDGEFVTAYYNEDGTKKSAMKPLPNRPRIPPKIIPPKAKVPNANPPKAKVPKINPPKAKVPFYITKGEPIVRPDGTVYRLVQLPIKKPTKAISPTPNPEMNGTVAPQPIALTSPNPRIKAPVRTTPLRPHNREGNRTIPPKIKVPGTEKSKRMPPKPSFVPTPYYQSKANWNQWVDSLNLPLRPHNPEMNGTVTPRPIDPPSPNPRIKAPVRTTPLRPHNPEGNRTVTP